MFTEIIGQNTLIHFLSQIEVDEDTGEGVSILTVTATDRDDGENARITYSMIAVPGFYIHPDTG